MNIRPVILSGGAGTRLWPVSRARAPKQFVPLTGSENLFIDTLRSVKDSRLFAPPLIVGNSEHKFLIQDALDAAGIKAAQVLLEPCGRNTAAAALAAALSETDDSVLHLLRPSDHVIVDLQSWQQALAQAVPAAEAGLIVTFGIAPSHPETGYGYILPGESQGFDHTRQIAEFKEKPDLHTASQMIARGALWNSGIFLYRPRTLIDEALRLAPDLLRLVEQALTLNHSDSRGITLDSASYAALASEPFDRVFMEKTRRGAVVPCAVGWSDVGSWQALWQAGPQDGCGNVVQGPVIAVETRNAYIRSDGPAVAVLDMQDIAVIATKDAVLVTPLSRTQDVKNLVTEVEKTHAGLAQDHPRARRPWGAYETIASGPQFQVKHITVLPGRSLSLQMHHHRAEHWVVVQGTARVECDEIMKLVFPNESVYIPKGAKHRLSNPGAIDLHLIEVQSGDYLGEDDIIRFADHYGRLSP